VLLNVKLTKNDAVAVFGHDKGTMDYGCPRVDDNHAAFCEFGCHAVTEHLKRKRLC